MNPYQILKVPDNATDKAIRQAYLSAIKACPPERDAARFRTMSTAYESIKDMDSRLSRLVYPNKPEADTPLEVAVTYARLEPPVPADINTLKRFLRGLA